MGCEADHPPAPTAKVKDMWSYISTPPYDFILCCLIKQLYLTQNRYWLNKDTASSNSCRYGVGVKSRIYLSLPPINKIKIENRIKYTSKKAWGKETAGKTKM
jgi:hypothetical protein